MFCNKCGHQLPMDSSFCNKCGNDLRAFAEAVAPKVIIGQTDGKHEKHLWIKKPLAKLSEILLTNILVCLGSLLVIFYSFKSIQKTYNHIVFKIKEIDILKKLVDLSYEIRGSAKVRETELNEAYVNLYLNIGKVVLLGIAILISILLLIYFIKALIKIKKSRTI